MALAPYASDPAASRGRRYEAAPSRLRDPFDRDRDRIVHSSAFRRLKHKTQVFVMPDGDHYRTRLTHSLEVAQIGRVLAGALGVHEGLTEAICLAHDLGHPPFGHEGEEALDHAMRPYGGFDHNGHTLRVLTQLESSYAAHPGLNLSWEVLEGLAKHNGPVASPDWALCAANEGMPLELTTHAGLEAQLAAIADDIAYDNHDLDDGLRSGLFGMEQLFAEVPLTARSFDSVSARYPHAREAQLIAETVRHQIGVMVDDVVAETSRRLNGMDARSAGDVRGAAAQTASFSASMREDERSLKRFLYANMYHHPAAQPARDSARRTVSTLFARLHDDPRRLPEHWERTLPEAEPARARHIGDFIAGMTDRYALRFGEELPL